MVQHSLRKQLALLKGRLHWRGRGLPNYRKKGNRLRDSVHETRGGSPETENFHFSSRHLSVVPASVSCLCCITRLLSSLDSSSKSTATEHSYEKKNNTNNYIQQFSSFNHKSLLPKALCELVLCNVIVYVGRQTSALLTATSKHPVNITLFAYSILFLFCPTHSHFVVNVQPACTGLFQR